MKLIFDIETEPYPDAVLKRMGADPDACLLDPSVSCVCAIGYRWTGTAAPDADDVPMLFPGTRLTAPEDPVIILGRCGPVSKMDAPCLSTWTSLDGQQCEAEILTTFWAQVRKLNVLRDSLVGYNSHGFDLPFLIRRSILLGVPWPAWLRSRNKWWSDASVDLRDLWGMGQPSPHANPSGKRKKKVEKDPAAFPTGGLDRLSRLLGLEGKNGDGTLFWSLYRSEDRAQQAEAIRYLENDVALTDLVGRRLMQ